MLSVVLIVPKALKAKADALAEAMGWGAPAYTVPVLTAGKVTHYGLQTWAAPEFVAMVEAAKAGHKPEALKAYPDADFAAVMAALIVSARATSEGHFDAVLAEHGLAREHARL